MLDVALEKYYELKQRERKIKTEIEMLRNQIVEELRIKEITVYNAGEYMAELKFMHEITPQFIQFLKATNNAHLIKETASCKTYQTLESIYNFSEDQEQLYYRLKKQPYLYVKKQ